ncbi:MAG TPA: hypothetical protein VM712_04045, partial [Gaiellales bacterium]|nr:hypothetical protein [Gaiellales bacterium]
MARKSGPSALTMRSASERGEVLVALLRAHSSLVADAEQIAHGSAGRRGPRRASVGWRRSPGHTMEGSSRMNRRADLSGLSPLQDPFSGGDFADLPDLPPVRIPLAVDLLDAATSSLVLQSVTGFVTWLGDGRRLDVDGWLTAADARAVAGALGLDGERPSELATLVRWARSAGLVRTVRGRLVQVKSRRALLGRPIDLWRQLFTTFAG